MTTAPKDPQGLASAFGKALYAAQFDEAEEMLRRPWTAADAEVFVRALHPAHVEVLVTFEHGSPALSAAADKVLNADPVLARENLLLRLIGGESVDGAALRALTDDDLRSFASRLTDQSTGHRGLLDLAEAVGLERLKPLVADPVAREVLALASDPSAASPVLDASLRAAFLGDFNPGWVEERPNPVGYAVSRFGRLSGLARVRAYEVLKALRTDRSAGTGFQERPMSDWAADTCRELVSSGLVAD